MAAKVAQAATPVAGAVVAQLGLAIQVVLGAMALRVVLSFMELSEHESTHH